MITPELQTPSFKKFPKWIIKLISLLIFLAILVTISFFQRRPLDSTVINQILQDYATVKVDVDTKQPKNRQEMPNRGAVVLFDGLGSSVRITVDLEAADITFQEWNNLQYPEVKKHPDKTKLLTKSELSEITKLINSIWSSHIQTGTWYCTDSYFAYIVLDQSISKNTHGICGSPDENIRQLDDYISKLD